MTPIHKNNTDTDTRAIALWRYAFLSVFLGCLAVLALLPVNAVDFSDRAIGITVATNTDVHRRLYIYILSLVALVALFCTIFLRPIQARVQQSGQQEMSVWVLLGACGLINLLGWLFTGAAQPFVQGAAIAFTLCAAQLVSRVFSGQVPQQDELVKLVCISWQATIGIFFILDIGLGYEFLLAWIPVLATTWLLREKITGNDAPTPVPGLVYGILLSPLLYVAAVEIAQLFFHDGTTPSRHGLVFAALLAGVILMGHLPRFRKSPGAFLCALCVLASTTLLHEYDSQIRYNFYDVFHLGERVLPLQQWTSYGLLPFIDYMPPHGLSDVMPQMLYHVLGQGEFLEAMIWGNGHFMGWLPRIIASAVLLYFLCRILPVPIAFFLLWLLPTYHVFEPYYTLFLLPALHIFTFDANRNRAGWWLAHWLLVFALFFWRPDFGIATIAGSGIVAVMLSYRSRQYSVMLQAILCAVLVAAPAFAFLHFYGGDGQLDRIALIAAYVGNQIPVASLPEFYSELNYDFFVQYVALPAISALILARLLVATLRREDSTALDNAIIFLAAVGLVLSLRSLQRHSLFEGDFNTFLHLFVALLFLVRQGVSLRWPGLAVLCGLFLMGTYLVTPQAESRFLKRMYHPSPSAEYPLPADALALHHWSPEEPRLVKEVDRYEDFEQLMSLVLADSQTFYDFTNAPLFYALADARLPLYFTQTAFQTSNTIQDYVVPALVNLHENGELPFVVFSQDYEALDNVDGVDRALRSYRIAEFIYANYAPCITVSELDIWIDRDLAGPGDCVSALEEKYELPAGLLQALTPLEKDYLEQFVDYRFLPYLWALEDKIPVDANGTGNLAIASYEPRGASLQLGDGGVCGNGPCYLDLAIRSESSQRVVASMFGREMLEFTLQPGEHTYRLRLSVLWEWHRSGPAPQIDLSGVDPFDVSWARLSQPGDNN